METTFKEHEWDDYAIDGDHLATCILLGDNFANFAKEGNEEGADFYILLCTQTCFVLDQPFICQWGQQRCVGDSSGWALLPKLGQVRFFIRFVEYVPSFVHTCLSCKGHKIPHVAIKS
jgi:hypothetical protein